ncbi:MAG: Hsp20/alpha crystallin family protein [Pseudomonadota bacterium]|nr:Hsp20/alpha crystallin family protein [Pseudomonadota bacterium]
MQADNRTSSQRAEPLLMPPVDIVEDATGIIVTADLPGVDAKDLSIGVENRTLTIAAPLTLGEANELVSVYTEVRANKYRRSFELSSELDTTAIEAAFIDGVLKLRLPKLERATPKRIEGKTA